MQDVVDKMNMKEIVITYGQTEASPGCTMSSIYDTIEQRVGTVGKALPEIECKIINPETGEECPDGENGEFVAARLQYNERLLQNAQSHRKRH